MQRILYVFLVDNKTHKQYDLSQYGYGIEHGILSVYSTAKPMPDNLEQEIFPLTSIHSMEIRQYRDM